MSDNQIVTVTEPASVEALKSLYEMYPNEFDWDFSIAGQVKSKDERLEVRYGDLIGLFLDKSHISDLTTLAWSPLEVQNFYRLFSRSRTSPSLIQA